MLTTVKKLGGSVAIVIPKAMASSNELTPGTTVDLEQSAEGIVVRRARARRRRSIDQIVTEIDPAAYTRRREESRQDAPMGKEVW
jgi:antitoxin component of MazEF toxin-antitoxin module